MKLAQSLFFITAATLLSGCIVVATPSHANYHNQEKLVLDAQSLALLDIDAGAGSLEITGSDNTDEISLVADIYTEKRNADNYQLELTSSGNSAFIISKINSSGFWQGDSPHIDIKIIVPNHMMLRVNDGSGSTMIKQIDAAVTVKDGSGDLTLKNINGDLDINDGSGGLYINNVVGKIEIVDGSGEIELYDVDGSIDIDDGSGSMIVKGISGDVNIDDGSGELTVNEVAGHVTINDGSGGINVEQVGGLKIIESGSGGLRVKKVKGGFEIGE